MVALLLAAATGVGIVAVIRPIVLRQYKKREAHELQESQRVLSQVDLRSEQHPHLVQMTFEPPHELHADFQAPFSEEAREADSLAVIIGGAALGIFYTELTTPNPADIDPAPIATLVLVLVASVGIILIAKLR